MSPASGIFRGDFVVRLVGHEPYGPFELVMAMDRIHLLFSLLVWLAVMLLGGSVLLLRQLRRTPLVSRLKRLQGGELVEEQVGSRPQKPVGERLVQRIGGLV